MAKVINKETQENLKAFCDNLAAKTKNGPRACFWDKLNAVYVDVPADGLGYNKMAGKSGDYMMVGIYDAKITSHKDWLYSDLGVKVKA